MPPRGAAPAPAALPFRFDDSQKPLTPTMQQEVDAIVFRPKRGQPPAAASPGPSSAAARTGAPAVPPLGLSSNAPGASPYLVQPLGAEPSYVNARSAFSGRDTEDHFVNSTEMTMDAKAGASMAFDGVYSERFAAKDSASAPLTAAPPRRSHASLNHPSLRASELCAPLSACAAEDHFGKGMVMAEENDTSLEFESVYSPRFEGKDSAWTASLARPAHRYDPPPLRSHHACVCACSRGPL